MKSNRGKQFEAKIKEAFAKDPRVSIDRFPDPMAGYAGFRNICDFVVYRQPYQYYIECKAFSGDYLNLNSGISEEQFKGLGEKAMIPGVMAGIIIWFIDYDITEFIPIQSLHKLKEHGIQSLQPKHIIENQIQHFALPGIKKRVFFNYDCSDLLDQLQRENHQMDRSEALWVKKTK